MALHHVEEHTAVGHKACGLAEFLAKGVVVEEKEVFKEQQSGRLVIGIAGYEFSQSIKAIFVQPFRMSYQLCYRSRHNCCFVGDEGVREYI
jgi:hypothetical protein